ncbi:hypothetical protein C8R44DRAFT_749599 [Mycena epipterygia]|nr:hypothetical protein C8R44DRAFT_749599 [Mycena epipterygia]
MNDARNVWMHAMLGCQMMVLVDSEGDGGVMMVVWAGKEEEEEGGRKEKGRDGAADGWCGSISAVPRWINFGVHPWVDISTSRLTTASSIRFPYPIGWAPKSLSNILVRSLRICSAIGHEWNQGEKQVAEWIGRIIDSEKAAVGVKYRSFISSKGEMNLNMKHKHEQGRWPIPGAARDPRRNDTHDKLDAGKEDVSENSPSTEKTIAGFDWRMQSHPDCTDSRIPAYRQNLCKTQKQEAHHGKTREAAKIGANK